MKTSVLLVVACTVTAGLFQAQAQNPAVCLSGNGCIGDDLGVMLPRGCCVDTPNGRSYRVPGQEICMECTVLGFLEESFIGVEQAEPYGIPVGYIKVRPGSAQTLTFTVGATDDSASNLDYTVNTAQVTFGAAGSSVSVTLNQDNVALEPNETFTLQLAANLNPQFFFFNNLMVTIVDGDVLNVTFERDIYYVNEDDGSVEVCLITNIGYAEAFDAVIEVVMKGVDNPAASDSDFDSRAQNVSFAPSGSSNRSCAQISIIDDFLFEGDEEFLVRLQSFSNSQIMAGEISEACVTIREDDVPMFNLSPESIIIVENNIEVEVCIILTSMLERNVTVTVETRPKIGAINQATAGSDYVTITFERTFTPMDEVSQMMCGQVQIIDDMLAYEPDEQFSVSLVSATPTGVFGSNETCITIMDNDVPEFNLLPESIIIVENNTEVEVCIILTSMLGRNVTVTAETRPKIGAINQATAGSDYVTITFERTFTPMDEASQMMCGRVQIIDDMLAYEPDEQFSVSLASATPTGVFGSNETCITIMDNDVSEFSLIPLATTVTEGNIEVQICITISGSIDRTVTVTAQTAPKVGASNQATAGSDYQSTTITVTFEPIAGSESAEMRCGNVRIMDDMVGEPDEQFSVRLISANPAGNFGNDETCVTIVDNDNELVCHENADLIEDPSGMLMCECKKGFTGDGITNCTDIDECMTVEDICDKYISCTNIEGSYTCQCQQEDGSDCITSRDVEDTSTRTKTKTKSKTKTRTMSSGSGRTTRSKRSGSKRSGSKRSGSRRMRSRCTPKQKTKGLCGCKEGYLSSPNGCIDIDECRNEELNDCSSFVQCINLQGSFKCVCTDCIIMDEELTSTKTTKRTKSSKKTKTKTRKTPK